MCGEAVWSRCKEDAREQSGEQAAVLRTDQVNGTPNQSPMISDCGVHDEVVVIQLITHD